MPTSEVSMRYPHPSYSSPRWREPELARRKQLAAERRRNKYFKIASRAYDDD